MHNTKVKTTECRQAESVKSYGNMFVFLGHQCFPLRVKQAKLGYEFRSSQSQTTNNKQNNAIENQMFCVVGESRKKRPSKNSIIEASKKRLWPDGPDPGFPG